MTDADAFLEAIRANPDDDLPRLVYADWMEERGEATYAEFIRVECQLERREPQTPIDRGRLRQRRHRLRSRLAREWKDLVGDDGRWMLFDSERGLFETEPFLKVELFLQLSPHWWPRFAIRTVHLFSPAGFEKELAAAPYLSRLNTLEIGWLGERWDDEIIWEQFLHELSRATHINGLHTLSIGPVRAGRSSLRALARTQFVRRLAPGSFVLRVALPTSDGSEFEYVQVASGRNSAAAAISRFLAEYGTRL